MAGGNSHQRAVAKAAAKQKPAPTEKTQPVPAEPSEPHRATRLEQLFASLTRLKNKKAFVALLFIGAVLGRVGDIYRFAVGAVDRFSEKLKIEERIAVFHEPWFYVLPPTNVSTQPIPMWTFFYLTLHNRDSRTIWINDYRASAHTRVRNRWIELTPPPTTGLFRMFGSEYATLKLQDDFNYNAASGPIAPDGYLGGWMFFGTCLAENVDKLEFEFHDKEGKMHRLQVGVGNGAFGGQPDQSATQSAIANVGGQHGFGFDNVPNPPNQGTPEPTVQAFFRRIRPYVSLFPYAYRDSLPPGQHGVEPCSKWTP
jgi:hypothetical protein